MKWPVTGKASERHHPWRDPWVCLPEASQDALDRGSNERPASWIHGSGAQTLSLGPQSEGWHLSDERFPVAYIFSLCSAPQLPQHLYP